MASWPAGCTSYKAESIAYHEKSAAHPLAQQCHKAKIHPEKTPANLARQQMLKQYTGKLRLLFRNAHAVSKNKKSLADYRWLCDLDEVKGLAIGATYRNSKACGTFTKYIATAAQSQVAEELTTAKSEIGWVWSKCYGGEEGRSISISNTVATQLHHRALFCPSPRACIQRCSEREQALRQLHCPSNGIVLLLS